MRILAINHEFPPLGGGGANANYCIARELVRLGHSVTVMTSHMRGLALVEDIEGIHVIRLRCLRRHASYSTLMESASWVARALPSAVRWARSNHPDVVQAFFALPNGPIAWAASRAAKCPFVIRLGGGDVPGNDPTRYEIVHRMLMPVTRPIMQAADALIVNSEGLRGKAKQAFHHLDFKVIPNGVDLEQFRPADNGEYDGPLRLLFVSRLIERKGLQYLIPALGQLRREGYDFHLRIVGDGPMRDRVRQLVTEAGLTDRVDMRGAVPHDELPDLYRDADVFVLPSLSEGMANVMLEATASGLAIVGTDVAGTRDLVEHGRNGQVVAVGDVAAIRNGIRAFLEEPTAAVSCGEASRRRVSDLSWRAIAESYAELYGRVLGGTRGGAQQTNGGSSNAQR